MECGTVCALGAMECQHVGQNEASGHYPHFEGFNSELLGSGSEDIVRFAFLEASCRKAEIRSSGWA